MKTLNPDRRKECPKCGAYLPNNASFCGNCGSRVRALRVRSRGFLTAGVVFLVGGVAFLVGLLLFLSHVADQPKADDGAAMSDWWKNDIRVDQPQARMTKQEWLAANQAPTTRMTVQEWLAAHQAPVPATPPLTAAAQQALANLRQKYPVYNDLDDQTLIRAVVEKYPVYRDVFSQASPDVATQPDIWEEAAAIRRQQTTVAATQPAPAQRMTVQEFMAANGGDPTPKWDSTPKEPRWKQLSLAYGFVCGQQAALESIERKFPDLAQDVRQSCFAFNSSAIGESVKGLEPELSSQLGDKWREMKEEVSSQIKKRIDGQQLTREQATAFLAEVKARGKGELPDSIRSALLSAHPRFSKNPGLELTEGWKQTFRTRGHQKAKGADFSVSFPASWSKREGNRPNIIQVFQSGAGHGLIMCNLMVEDIPLPALTPEELKEFFQPNRLKDMIPEDGTLIDAQSIVLEGAPAGMIVFDQTMQRLDISLTMRMTQFVTIQGTSIIFIQFVVAKMPDSTESLDDLQKKYLPTYRAIANTFVFNERYK